MFGTFDILHPGHVYFLKKARSYGDSLVVIVARDANVKKVKGLLPKNKEQKRLKQLREISFVNKAVLGDEKDMYAVIKKIKPNVICLGYDQKVFTELLEKRLRSFKLRTKVVRLKAYQPGVFKSSKLR